jgi:hypothetical protein
MRIFRNKCISALLLLSAPALFAAQISGTASNGTTGKPAAGDEVVLLSLASGMEEIGHSRTDAQGHFALNVPDDGAQHLVRVAHQGVNYYRAAPPGTLQVDISVYDGARQVPNILQESRVLRLQARQGELEVSEAYTLRNESQPPRTKTGDQTLAISIPEGAKVVDGMVAGPGGMPTTSLPMASGKPNRYAFSYALKPGRSQFQVVYRLPYNGSYEFTITPDTAVAELGVLLPKTMKLTSSDGKFSPDVDENGMAVFFAKSLAADQPVRFSVAGEGSAPQGQSAPGAGNASAKPVGPGGGLGTPNDAPDPLTSSRGFIIGGLLLALGAGALWLVRMSKRKVAIDAAETDDPLVRAMPAAPANLVNGPIARSSNPPLVRTAAVQASGSIVDALKEELFQLESDRLRQLVSQQEYEASKAGLDALLRRHLKI